MKDFDLKAMGLTEMSAKEIQNTNGGFIQQASIIQESMDESIDKQDDDKAYLTKDNS